MSLIFDNSEEDLEIKEIGVYNKDLNVTDNEKNLLFNHMMNIANDIFNSHENRNKQDQFNKIVRHPILDLIKLIGMRIQAKYLTNLLYNINGETLPNLLYENLIFDDYKFPIADGKNIRDFFLMITDDKEMVSLKNDLVLPWPWNKNRLVSTLVNIGENRNWDVWSEDTKNHRLELWLPMRIGFVNGGNHSISVGILQGEGEITPDYILDVSPIYEHVFTDGINYYHVNDDSIIAESKSVEFSVLFEIGRLMNKKGI